MRLARITLPVLYNILDDDDDIIESAVKEVRFVLAHIVAWTEDDSGMTHMRTTDGILHEIQLPVREFERKIELACVGNDWGLN